jgi:hypothetical protein
MQNCTLVGCDKLVLYTVLVFIPNIMLSDEAHVYTATMATITMALLVTCLGS